MRAAKLFRYGQAGVGPVASAGAQFLLALLLLRLLDAHAFGSFSFLLVASQFSWGLWSALFCAPLPILLVQQDADGGDRLVRAMLGTSLIGSFFAAAVFLAGSLALGLDLPAALLFAAYGGIALLRWFARAHAYATQNPLRTMWSDLAYSVTVLVGGAAVYLSASGSLEFAYGALLVGAVIGLAPFGGRYLQMQFSRPRLADLRNYGMIWRKHSGWSLLGVITTEATANSHAYLVTVLAGPAAFAAIAASALLIRPIGVAMNALNEFERAQMARQIGAGRIDDAIASVRSFRLVLMAAWIVTAGASAILLIQAPRLLFPDAYPLDFLVVAAMLWLAVAGMRLIRAPESALLQAAGAFRPLAFASVWSSGVSLAAVLALLLTVGPLWSILGILLGELLFAAITYIQAHRWRRRA
jgi:hypothetical protein